MINVSAKDLSSSSTLRMSLKRGFASQALAQAAKADADLASIFETCRTAPPNRTAIRRLIGRLQKRRGVVQAGASEGGQIRLVLRNHREALNRVDGQELFSEPVLVYTLLAVELSRKKIWHSIMRASFCAHAMERLIERSECEFAGGLLPLLDAEALCLLRSIGRDDVIEHDGDDFVCAGVPGVWAGSFDLAEAEEDWGLTGSPKVPMFSARTFLAPDQMKPEVWLRWRRDPAVTLS